MRDKRAIIIKNPELQRIRNSLRSIFIESILVEMKKFRDQRRKLVVSPDGSRKTVDDLSQKELKQFRQLQEQENLLSSALDKSILICVACGKGNRDMVYNKSYDAWYCTECYDMHRVYAERTVRSRRKDKSEPLGHEDKAMNELSRSFL